MFCFLTKVWYFGESSRCPYFFSRCGNLIFVRLLEEGTVTKGGSKSAKPEAGRALMECLRAGEGKAVIRI